jgi:hypothetical protein
MHNLTGKPLFTNPNDPNNIALKVKLTNWIMEKYDLKESPQLEIIEKRCSDSGCMHSETEIIITLNNQLFKKITISKPLVYVRKWDV